MIRGNVLLATGHTVPSSSPRTVSLIIIFFNIYMYLGQVRCLSRPGFPHHDDYGLRVDGLHHRLLLGENRKFEPGLLDLVCAISGHTDGRFCAHRFPSFRELDSAFLIPLIGQCRMQNGFNSPRPARHSHRQRRCRQRRVIIIIFDSNGFHSQSVALKCLRFIVFTFFLFVRQRG